MDADTSHWFDLATIRSHLDGEGTSQALCTAYLARIADENPRLNSFVSTRDEEVLSLARASDARRAAGGSLGLLDGIPVAIKDLVGIAGEVVSVGSLAWRERRAERTATLVRRLLGAGLPIIGRTAMVEFACGGWGTNTRLGTPHNPWCPVEAHAPGGSSSGSGVAVAAGLAPLAIGTDTGGSVRLPAALCGITGLKVTCGRISLHGIHPLSPTLDSVGPMTRCARSAAALLEVLNGPDASDPDTYRAPAFSIDRVDPTRLSRFTIGVLDSPELADADREVAAAFDTAVKVLAQLGARIVERRVPEPMKAIQARCGALIMAEGYAGLASTLEDETLADRLDPNVRQRLLGARSVGAAEYTRILEDMAATRRRWQSLLDGVDLLVLPTAPFPAPSLSDYDEASYSVSVFTRAFNYLDWCALAIPMGFSSTGMPAAGMPLSLQIVGAPFAEAKVLSAGYAFQDSTDWHQRMPPTVPGPG